MKSTVSAPSLNTARNASAATATPACLTSAASALVLRKPCQAFEAFSQQNCRRLNERANHAVIPMTYRGRPILLNETGVGVCKARNRPEPLRLQQFQSGR